MTTPQSHTIIIKKKKVVAAHAHHGGAWKVAYADFVTAMMAFFLLMWLLNATTEDQRKGLADYFNPSIPVSRISGGGAAALNGSSVMSEQTLTQDGIGGSADFAAPAIRDDESEEASQDAAQPDLSALETVERQINAAGESLREANLSDHIRTRMTRDGLVVELVDQDDSPLFDIGSARPSPLLLKLLDVVAPVLATVSNDMHVIGHTDARPFAGDAAYTNWELSADRANVSRRLLIDYGLPAGQIVAVVGKAETEPLGADAFASQNRRIAMLLVAGDRPKMEKREPPINPR